MERFTDVLTHADMQNAYTLIRHLDGACRRAGIEYAMDGGMLVGSMVHHGRIPWDDDFDVYIRWADRTRAVAALQQRGFVVTSAGRYSKLWSTDMPRVDNQRSWNWPFVDIGWLMSNATHTWERRVADHQYRNNIYPSAWIFPSVKRPYGPLLLSAPRHADAFLTYRFGPRWAETCVANHWDHKREKWRYNSVALKDTRQACAVLGVDTVVRRINPDRTSDEWVQNTRNIFHFVNASCQNR